MSKPTSRYPICKYPERGAAAAWNKGCRCERCTEYKRISKAKQRQNPAYRVHQRKIQNKWAQNKRDTDPNYRAKMLAKSAARRAMKKNGLVHLTDIEKIEIDAFYKHAKYLTETTGIQYHVDHIIPLAKGGLHHPKNLQILKAEDNMRKGAKLPPDYADRIKHFADMDRKKTKYSFPTLDAFFVDI